MAQLKNNNQDPKRPIVQSDSDKKLVNRWYDYYIDMQEVLENTYRYFNDRTLSEYLEDSTKRFNGYIPPRQNKYDWQAHTWNNATRNKTMALFAKMGLTRPDIKLQAVHKGDLPSRRLSGIVHDAYKYSETRSNESMQYFFETLDGAVKGTEITYEGYKTQYRKVKDIDTYNPLTGEMTFTEREIKEYNDCYSEICNLTDFYIWNPYERDLQSQARIIWRKRMPIDEFRYQFAKYKNVAEVRPNNQLTGDFKKDFYGMDWTQELEAEEVEVLYCFEKEIDEMVIIGNGIVVQDGPFPWKHKQYPFAKTFFEPFDAHFFWGNSLPNKMQNDQDVLNTLYNMAFDKTYLSIFPPILDSTINEIEDEILVPGRRMPVEDTNSMRELKISSVDSGHFNMLQLVSRNIDLSSVSETAQGQTGSGSTAREVVLAEENARKILGLFNIFMEDLVYQKAKLRIPNILQFYTMEERFPEIVGEENAKALQSAYRHIRLDDAELEEGKIGIRMIRLVGEAPITPENQTLQDNRIASEEKDFLSREGTPIHIIEVPASYVRNLDVDVQIVKGSGYMKSKSTEMALFLEMIKYVMSLFPDMVNRQALYQELMRLYDLDPQKFDIGGGQDLVNQLQPGQNQQAGRGALGQTETVRNLAGRNGGNLGESGRESQLANISAGDLSAV